MYLTGQLTDCCVIHILHHKDTVLSLPCDVSQHNTHPSEEQSVAETGLPRLQSHSSLVQRLRVADRKTFFFYLLSKLVTFVLFGCEQFWSRTKMLGCSYEDLCRRRRQCIFCTKGYCLALSRCSPFSPKFLHILEPLDWGRCELTVRVATSCRKDQHVVTERERGRYLASDRQGWDAFNIRPTPCYALCV